MSNGAVGDGPETEWTWKPAMQDRRSQPKVIVGAMIFLAVSCAVAGFVAGRLSGHTSHVGRDVAVASQPAAAPPVNVPRDGELGVSTPSSPAVAVKILNPGYGGCRPAGRVSQTDTEERRSIHLGCTFNRVLVGHGARSFRGARLSCAPGLHAQPIGEEAASLLDLATCSPAARSSQQQRNSKHVAHPVIGGTDVACRLSDAGPVAAVGGGRLR